MNCRKLNHTGMMRGAAQCLERTLCAPSAARWVRTCRAKASNARASRSKQVKTSIDKANFVARINRIVLKNFKSYGGRHTIGPFGDFTAVIGPNGAGEAIHGHRLPN